MLVIHLSSLRTPTNDQLVHVPETLLVNRSLKELVSIGFRRIRGQERTSH
jgi:hypothetical protein